MKKIIKNIEQSLSALILVLLTASLAPDAAGQNAMSLNTELAKLALPQSAPNWIDFRKGTVINPTTVFTDLKEAFGLSTEDKMVIGKIESDNLGFNHYRYQQYYKNLKVMYGEFYIHQQPDGFVKSANGRLITGLNLDNNSLLTEQQALTAALQFMNAKKYMWQNSSMEKELKRQEKDTNATYYPEGELMYAPDNRNAICSASEYKLCWNFKIYPDGDLIPKSVFINALTGTVIHHIDIAMNCSSGSGTSTFNGTVSINTQLNGPFISHNDCQGTHIFVYNCVGGAPSNNFYFDSDNIWIDQSAVQAQWGAMKTYEYYKNVHARTSWNNASADLVIYNSATVPGLGVNNACWGCAFNAATLGKGNTSNTTDDWNTDDIMGHEISHGVTQTSAGLLYLNESGALNESFSDIFGEMVESWAEGNCDYKHGTDRGTILRSFINPNTCQQPDTYLGTFWTTDTADNGGVHTNSGVQNRWFYLLAEGGSGTNDLGVPYNVTGIGRSVASQIAYRALTVYLLITSGYIDSRVSTLHAAEDLFGICSNEAMQVANAWRAVGVESQSGQFTKNVCGSYPFLGTFVQAISTIYAANGCTAAITPSATQVEFMATDGVYLKPGFIAQAGSNFRAYLEPCSITLWKSSSPTMNDAEMGIKNNGTPATNDDIDNSSFMIAPNPFKSNFDLSFNLTKDEKARIVIYNAIGIKVKDLAQRNLSKGKNKVSFDCSDLSSGVYMMEINLGDVKTLKKIVKN